MNTWINDLFGKDKAIIGLCHLIALPGDPLYDEEGGMEKVYQLAKNDVLALQEGGIDGIQFTNEFSLPYTSKANFETVSAMSHIIGRLKPDLQVPFGVNCIGDAIATIGLCATTGASFTRGSFHGTWATNGGLMNSTCDQVYRLRNNLRYNDLKLVHYVLPESSADIGNRDIVQSLKTHVFLNSPDALGVAGTVAGQPVDINLLDKFKKEYKSIPLFAVTGVGVDNAKEIMAHADAAFVGTSLKIDGVFSNPIDIERVKSLMEIMAEITGGN